MAINPIGAAPLKPMELESWRSRQLGIPPMLVAAHSHTITVTLCRAELSCWSDTFSWTTCCPVGIRSSRKRLTEYPVTRPGGTRRGRAPVHTLNSTDSLFMSSNMPFFNCTFSYAHGRGAVTIFRLNPPLVLHVSEEFEGKGPGEGLHITIEGSDVCFGIRVVIGDAYSNRCGVQ